MGLRELSVEKSYISYGEDNIVKSLIGPALKVATKYKRSVGFFSSSVFSMLADDIIAFVRSKTYSLCKIDIRCAWKEGLSIEETVVQDKIEYMSSRLFNETYGNIVIFVCHFANNSDIIDTVLLNAYDTLPNYEAFDFTKTNTVFEEIEDAVDTLIPKIIASSDADVSANKDSRLARMDELGVNDGQINRGEDTIDDEISEQEKDMADVVAALKTIEVLGEILQNYPVGIEGEKKVEIIDEIQKLGMRSVQAIIKTMGYLEKDLVEYVYARASREKKYVSKEQIVFVTRQFINLLITGMARGMVHQVAVALNSEHLLLAAKKAFEEDNSISSKLVLLDLELNCLNICNYTEIKGLKKEYNLNYSRG